MAFADGLLLAVDQGTTLTKTVVFDVDGGIVGSAVRETAVSFSGPARADCDAEHLWQRAAECIRLALGQLRPERIQAVGLCGFMHTLIPVDGAGNPLYRPMLWPDQRCAQQVSELADQEEAIRLITGKKLTTLSSLPRLLWLRRHAPHVLAEARAFLLPKDFLRVRLTGELATDPRDAQGTGLVERSTGAWSARLLDLAGISSERMPPIRRPDEVAGVVTPAASAATGLAVGTPVVVGTGDWPATLIGSGCFLPERTCFYLGSAGILGSYASADDLDTLGTTHYFGSVTSTGTALRWIRELLYQASDPLPSYDEMFAETQRSDPGARGLMFLPHLMGERGGVMRPHARGTLYGLTLAHQRADVVRSVLEGTAIWLHMVSEAYTSQQIGDLMVFGGGARSPLWRQICGAVFGRPLLLPRVTEGAALGVAMLAAVSQGIASGYLDLARRWGNVAQVEVPDPRLVETYACIDARYRRLEATIATLEEAGTGESFPPLPQAG
ncbi:xylulokinase [Actinopolymorpha pittospori]|uniref:Xylulokinase n=1 Tax=Actinopolymorpha pittospori TaxID=648752 RepID=A0A927MYG4_9ACTN|nr:FGGY family carbohydrate kinase [Actinopolymorpha pittospori]MBE1608527.1 xylulokinase [Actinopolymorpha pittospori]